MTSRTKMPLIQSIVPNLEDYIEDVQLFYNEKIELILRKINQFIEFATYFTEIPQQLVMQFSLVKSFAKQSHEEKEIDHLIMRDQIEQFLNLKDQALEYQTGTKFMYPELPKIQRNLNKRKYSKSDSMQDESQRSDNSESKESINQICDLLGTLNLQSKTSQQICEQIQNIVVSMNGLSLKESIDTLNIPADRNGYISNCKNSIQQQSPRSKCLQRMKSVEKLELRRFEIYLINKCEQMKQENFKQICGEKLCQIKQLFRAHLEKSVMDVLTDIQKILSKALKDIKENDKAYVPIYKISAHFNKLNLKFYRSQGVVKCLNWYLTRKVKECTMDGVHTLTINGVQTKVRTNFRMRFFKHIILENIFFMWLKQAVADFNKMVNDQGSEERNSDLSEKIECEKETKTQVENEQEMSEIFLFQSTSHSYNNFIM